MAEPLRTHVQLTFQMISGLAYTAALLFWYVGHRKDWWAVPGGAVTLAWAGVGGYGLVTGRLRPSSDLNFYLTLAVFAVLIPIGIRAIAWALSQKRAAQNAKRKK